MNDKQKPSIRFKGFTEAWEQRKLSELVQIERGGSPRPIDDFITDAPNGLNWVKIGDAPTQGNYITKTAEKIRPEGLSKTREVHPGDLILSNSMSFGKPYIMGIDGCIHDGWLLIRNTYGVFDLTFLCHLLGTPQMLSQYRSLAAGSTVNNLNKELVGNTVVTIPSITEQRVLGDYLERLDNLITLHQRKYDKLVNVKKSMLEKMFPRDGKNVPEIRFSGFTEAWEQRKLGNEATEMLAGGDIDKDIILDKGNYPVIANALTDDGIVGYYDNEYRVKAPAVTITGRGDVGHAKARNVDFTPVVRLLSLKSNHDVLFLENAINTLKIVVESTGVPQLTVPQLANYEVYFPKTLEEEKKIGKYFEQLDRLITLHQREVEKLQNIKKSCLEKMFV